MLAGNVVASAVDGVLTLTGDDLANAFEIVREAPFIDVEGAWLLRITGLDGTTINGNAEALFPMDNQHVRIDTRGGDDSVVVAGVILRALDVDLGEGDDRLVLRTSRIRSDVWIDAGAGDDRIELRDLVAQASVQVTGGLGRDRVSFSRVSVGEALSIEDYSGAGRVTVNRTTVAGSMRIETGNSIDRIELQSSAFTGDASIRTRGQDDSVRVRGTVFEGQSPINAGIGTNEIDREVILEWDFDDGAQGWRSGFSDISINVVDFDDPRLFNEGRDRGIRQLPDDVGIHKNAYYLALNNSSDDAFVFLFRDLEANQGLVPNQAYQLSFSVDVAGDAFSGALGGGGSPSSSVYLKVGGSRSEPTLMPADPALGGVARLNIDIGNQSQGGTNASVAGNVANDVNPLTPRAGGEEEYRFRLFRREHTHPVAIKTDSSGRLFVIIGTDSGFEGITRLYYARINITLTPVSDVPIAEL
jgi:hypothetical protein